MDRKSFDRRWAAFARWDRRHRRAGLRKLTIEEAAKMFNDLWELQSAIPPGDLKRLRMRRVMELAAIRIAIERAIRRKTP
jgi:hypothetical protein